VGGNLSEDFHGPQVFHVDEKWEELGHDIHGATNPDKLCAGVSILVWAKVGWRHRRGSHPLIDQILGRNVDVAGVDIP
jgi:hypothetical protein